MVGYVPSSGSRVKGFAFGGGSGDFKDKLMIGGLIVVIGVAIVALVMSIIKRPPNSTDITEWAFKCMEECGNEWTYHSEEEFAEALEGMEGLLSPPDIMIDMGGPFPPMPCPECGLETGEMMSKCPKCERYYHHSEAIQGKRRKTREICPHCQTDVRKFHSEQASGKK